MSFARSVLVLLPMAVLYGCHGIDCTPEDPCYDVETRTFHDTPVGTTSAAGRFVAWTDGSAAIHGHLLGAPVEAFGPGSPLAVASDGNDHVMLVMQGTELHARRVSDRSDTVLTTDPIGGARLLVASGGYVAAWISEKTGYVARLDAAGEMTGGPWAATAPGFTTQLSLAVDDTGAALTWTEIHERLDPQTGIVHVLPADLHLRRIANDGALGPDLIHTQATEAAISGDARGFVLASRTFDGSIEAERLDVTLASAGSRLLVASPQDVGMGGGIDIAGTIDAYVVRYISLGSSPTSRPALRSRVGGPAGLGVNTTFGVGYYCVLSAYEGWFHALWVEHRFQPTGSDSYDEYFDLNQAELRADGASGELLD